MSHIEQKTFGSVPNMLRELSAAGYGAEILPPPNLDKITCSSLHGQSQYPGIPSGSKSSQFSGAATSCLLHTEQAARSMKSLEQMADQNHVTMYQQRSFSEPLWPDREHRDAFDEFVLFDMTRPARGCAGGLPMINELEQHSGSGLPMVWSQPKSVTDQPQSHRSDAEVESRRQTYPPHASSSERVSPSRLSTAGNQPRSMTHQPQLNRSDAVIESRSQTQPMHESSSKSVSLHTPSRQISNNAQQVHDTNAQNVAGRHSARSLLLMQPKAPTVPAHRNIPDVLSFDQPRSLTNSENVNDVPSMPQRSWTAHEFFNNPENVAVRPPTNQASTASSVGSMPPSSTKDLAYQIIPGHVPLGPPRNQVGFDSAASDVLRSLTDPAYASGPDLNPAIDSIVATTQLMLKHAQDMRGKPSLAREQSMAAAASRSTTLISQSSGSCLMLEAADAPSTIASGSVSMYTVEEEDSESADSGSDYDVLVGPTELISAGLGLSNLALPAGDRSKKLIPMLSRPHLVAMSDGIRLARAQSFKKPLSFGSALHLMGKPQELCRPCMFEQRPGRCKKSFGCDFCHVGHRRPQTRKTKTGQDRGGRSRWMTA